MADVAITPASTPDYRVATRVSPQYLISIENNKKTQLFLATKFDDTSPHYSKFVGFYVEGSSDEIVANYVELLSSADTSNYIEILIPHTRVCSIRNLIYKHKVK